MKEVGNKKQRRDIELLSRNYRDFKLLLDEVQGNVASHDYRKIEAGIKIIAHIENVIDSLEEDDRFIIEKEVIEGKRGNWYLDYFSASSYYRHRNRAYMNFLRCL